MALIQSAFKAAGAVTSSTLAFPSAVGAGHFKGCAICGGGTGNTESASDSLDGAYTQDNVLLASGTTASLNSKPNASGGATTVTFAQTVSAQLRALIFERDDIATTSPADQPASHANSLTTAFTTGATAATTATNEVAIAMMCDSSGSATVTAGAGYTLDPSSIGKLWVEYQTGITLGSLLTAGFTLSSVDNGPAILVTYKPTGGGGGGGGTSQGGLLLRGVGS